MKTLFSLLDKTSRHSVIWVTGPPGSGKTILISSYIDSRALPCLWYQIDKGDADIATFFYYMGIAASRGSPRKKPLPLLTPEYIPGLSTFTSRYFEGLYSRLRTPSLIIFDNYQEVPAGSPFHEVMRDGLEAIPQGIKVIAISRGEPPAEFARLRANNSIEIIGWERLKLSLKESSGIMLLKQRKRLSREAIKEIHEKADGWAAGIILMLEKVKSGGHETPQLDIATIDTIYDYFQSELLGKLDCETRDFLLKTAILPFMDSQMSGHLTGVNRSRQILLDLSRNNCFTEKRFDKDPVYKYHSLFRRFLLSKAKDHFSVEEIIFLKKKAGLLLDESGRYEDAFVLFRDTLEWDGIVSLILRHAQTLLHQGRMRVLEEWITSLPPELADKEPWIRYWLGLCRINFNPLEGRSQLERTFELFKAESNPAGVYLSWSAIVNSFTFGLDDLKSLDSWILMMDELIRTFGGFPSEEIEARVSSSMFMALVYRQPRHPDFDYWRTRAFGLLRKSGDINLKALVISNYALYNLNSGRLEEAAIAIDSYRRLVHSGNPPPIIILKMKWIEAMHSTYVAAHEICMETISEGLELSASTGIHVMDFLLMGQGTLSALDAYDLDTAERLLDKMASVYGGEALIGKGYYRYLLAYHALINRDIKEAVTHADEALKQAINTGFLLAVSLCHLENAHVMHELKKDDKALRHIKEGRKIGREINYRYAEFIALLTDALFAFDLGKEKAGFSALQKALALGRESGYMNTHTLPPKSMARLCCKALQAGIETGYVKGLIKKRNLIPEALSLDIEDWPWPLKVYTLGRFFLVRNGKPILFTKKAQRRPLDLLKAIIALGGREVDQGQIIDILWPEADGDAAHNAFKITLHRLRFLAGDSNSVNFRDGKVLLDSRYWWVDTWAFERLLGRGDTALKDGRKEESIYLFQKAIALYRGVFLTGDDSIPQIVSYRDKMKSRFLSGLSSLGRLYEEKGEIDKAIDTFKKGMEIDAIAEEFYQYLMACYQRFGHKAEAIEVYSRLKQTLHSLQGADPSPETEAIYRSILRG